MVAIHSCSHEIIFGEIPDIQNYVRVAFMDVYKILFGVFLMLRLLATTLEKKCECK